MFPDFMDALRCAKYAITEMPLINARETLWSRSVKDLKQDDIGTGYRPTKDKILNPMARQVLWA